MRTFGLSHQIKGPTTVKVAKTGSNCINCKKANFTVVGPLIWCDNPKVRMSKILYINNNDFHHLGRSQICAGAWYVFRISKPHSERVWTSIFEDLPFSTEYNSGVPGPQGAGAAPTLQWAVVSGIQRHAQCAHVETEAAQQHQTRLQKLCDNFWSRVWFCCSRVRTNQKKVVKTTFQFQAIFPNQTLHQKDVTESAPLRSRREL